jgi:predicted DNA-binding transcriptional regulator AlpA
MQQPKLLNTSDAAAYLGISRGTLEHWRTETPPRGPNHVRLGFQVRYRPEDLDRWLSDQTIVTSRTELGERHANL